MKQRPRNEIFLQEMAETSEDTATLWLLMATTNLALKFHTNSDLPQ